jgi:hypothetical protein
MSVPAAGKKYFGLTRDGAYDAAARGDLPTIRIGRLLRVPVRALEAMLNEAGQRREKAASFGGAPTRRNPPLSSHRLSTTVTQRRK